MRIVVFTVTALLFSASVSAQIYKWVDETGKIHYTDQPPPPHVNTKEQQLNINTAPAAGSHPGNPSNALSDEREEFEKRRKQRQENEAKDQAQAEINKKKCTEAQTQLRMYADSPRLTIPDGAGGIVYVDDDLRQRRIDDANKAIATFCR
ncbi:DUF4124 domain-containing protein [Nitrosomonas ureae]|uniref:Uncharacterized protein DUF4124 n=1 Tax=Nitrosomonas ureae TaxID=44577 RepID=A0A0S3AMF6_9PROT|nr:DUF4124 domain-containing protein [Nitrosomonas ureae]ALQ52369.1 hypothetical protein ATY38_14820 [Nitrosomonas ureae]PTQ86977.1 uncharacterized protein DUF4124 [Nitrosomonas ureae]PXX14375.1 uncharacterized protein DUF4124 [Nitrosomonas ureae]SDT88781.1 protein of unknown function [Nitrosomonas ureae]SEQ36592.1 protein of unknown function [Nitrosomonas ureae]